MSDAFYIGGVGLSAQQLALDTIANNITNMSTHGFKRDTVQFAALVGDGRDNGAAAATAHGVVPSLQHTLDRQGDIEVTGNAMDLAIDGVGFIEVVGARGQSFAWRGGSLEVTADGWLAAPGGMVLRAMINVPYDATDLNIASDGTVSAALADDGEVTLGSISLLRVGQSDVVDRLDGGFYSLEDSGFVQSSLPGEDGLGQLVQGSLEQSNVDLNDEMVSLMIVQRAYAANAKVVQAADEVLSLANNLRR